QDYHPDLILMDLHMPELDGIRLTTLIRQQPGQQLLPIVFLTGDPDPERQFEVLDSGADDFLTKPIRPRHLIAAVSNRIRRARQQALQQVG
ncbi:response regulator, partial [Xanthomonas oryzae pv. oryzae]